MEQLLRYGIFYLLEDLIFFSIELEMWLKSKICAKISDNFTYF